MKQRAIFTISFEALYIIIQYFEYILNLWCVMDLANNRTITTD